MYKKYVFWGFFPWKPFVYMYFWILQPNQTREVDFLENICIKHGWNANFPLYMDCVVPKKQLMPIQNKSPPAPRFYLFFKNENLIEFFSSVAGPRSWPIILFYGKNVNISAHQVTEYHWKYPKRTFDCCFSPRLSQALWLYCRWCQPSLAPQWWCGRLLWVSILFQKKYLEYCFAVWGG